MLRVFKWFLGQLLVLGLLDFCSCLFLTFGLPPCSVIIYKQILPKKKKKKKKKQKKPKKNKNTKPTPPHPKNKHKKQKKKTKKIKSLFKKKN